MPVYYPSKLIYEIGEVLLCEDQIEKKEKWILDKYKAEVYSGERDIPHIHFTKRGEHDICVCIYSNKFYVHSTHTGTLSSNKYKELDKWMRKRNNKFIAEDRVLMNWEVAVILWWRANPNCRFKVSGNPEMSDYIKMGIRKEN